VACHGKPIKEEEEEQDCGHATSSVVIFKSEDTKLLLIANKRTETDTKRNKNTTIQKTSQLNIPIPLQPCPS
jgi:hypothetical protein